jgi:glutamine synthetase type III
MVLIVGAANNRQSDALHRGDRNSIERIVADDLWPLPTYQEMLFIL